MSEKTKRISLFKNGNLILLIVSAFLAFLLWITLSMTVFPETTVYLKNVPIDFSLEQSYVADIAGLSIMSKSHETVNLSIKGLRYKIGDYSADDVHVGINLDNVKAPGTYDLSLVVTSVAGDDIQVVHEPLTVKVEFDNMISKVFSVEDGTLVADVSKISAAEGYLLDDNDVTITPSSVELYGPKDYIDKITYCSVVANSPATVKQSVTTSNTSLVMYNESNEFYSEKITADTDKFQLEVPVSINKDLKIDIGFRPYYTGFDFDSLTGKYTIEPGSITVKSQDDRILGIDSIPVGDIDIRTVTVGTVFSGKIPASPYYTNVSGIENVFVSFDLEGYSTKNMSLSIDRVKILYPPVGYKVEIITDIIKDVAIVGPSEIIENISSLDVVAELDFMNYGTISGNRYATVNIRLPDYNQCWAFGEYRIIINVVEDIADDVDVGEQQD